MDTTDRKLLKLLVSSGMNMTVQLPKQEPITFEYLYDMIKEAMSERFGPNAITNEKIELLKSLPEDLNDETEMDKISNNYGMVDNPGATDYPEYRAKFQGSHYGDTGAQKDVRQRFHDISGGYTERDNRRIDRNVEFAGTYNEGDNIVNNKVDGNWKAFCAGGGVATTAFYGGLTTAKGPSYPRQPTMLPGKHALVAYDHYSIDQLPSFVLTFAILPTVLIQLFSAILQPVLLNSRNH
ncbi:hypothetical protein K435DRAFT_774443 [Dendrothele bispora CBS 962.96]|uniref:Uncharacterized protein n=1 Tax=Dendrothele bispora (strain CBS 962.96) TaxID=1314807 RepID=A0A4S8MNJ9_DENBC|nr:hypothetical protein K435DRAFT_774443 [Dendrothele bispora CBS 962.96]